VEALIARLPDLSGCAAAEVGPALAALAADEYKWCWQLIHLWALPESFLMAHSASLLLLSEHVTLQEMLPAPPTGAPSPAPLPQWAFARAWEYAQGSPHLEARMQHLQASPDEELGCTAAELTAVLPPPPAAAAAAATALDAAAMLELDLEDECVVMVDRAEALQACAAHIHALPDGACSHYCVQPLRSCVLLASRVCVLVRITCGSSLPTLSLW
jgi:hypothetical protein